MLMLATQISAALPPVAGVPLVPLVPLVPPLPDGPSLPEEPLDPVDPLEPVFPDVPERRPVPSVLGSSPHDRSAQSDTPSAPRSSRLTIGEA
jgi:hypothetical protein